MPGICDGRVVIVTGGGRGIGAEHAVEFARHGARVVVNDLGGAPDGSGADAGPAAEVVERITAMGGEASPEGRQPFGNRSGSPSRWPWVMSTKMAIRILR